MKKKEEKEVKVVHKPNQIIMVTNKDITATQRKAYNIILHKAWNELKIDPNKRAFDFSMADLKEMAGIQSTNNTELKKSLEKLKHVDVETLEDNGDWAIFSLISSAKKTGDLITIELPMMITEALITNTFYTTLDLLILKSLEGKYAVILYEMAIRYHKVQIPEMTVEEFRSLTGTKETKSYDDFGMLRQKVLKPAIEEINEKTDIIINYKETTLGRKVVKIKFFIEKKEVLIGEEPVQNEENEGLLELFKEKTGQDFPIALLNELVEEKGFEIVKLYFDNIERFSIGGKPVGFMLKAIKEAWKIPPLVTKKPTVKSVPNSKNFEQRKYDEDFLNNLYENE